MTQHQPTTDAPATSYIADSDTAQSDSNERMRRETYDFAAPTETSERRLEYNNSSAENSNRDWKAELVQTDQALQTFRSGNFDQSHLNELTTKIDSGYQRLLPYLNEKSAAVEQGVHQNVNNHFAAERQMHEIINDLAKANTEFIRLGKWPVSSDDIANAQLNYANQHGHSADDPTFQKLQKLAALEQEQQRFASQGGEALALRKAALIGSVDYANHIDQDRGGTVPDVSDPTGRKYVTSKQVLDSARTPEAMATPEYQQAVVQSQNQEMAAVRELLPNNNPLVTLSQAKLAERTDPARAHSLYLQAVKQAENLPLEELEKKAGDDPRLKAAFESLSQAEPTAQISLGWNMLKQENPDYAAAQELIQAASGEPVAKTIINERGTPLIPQFMLRTMTDGKSETADFKNTVEGIQNNFAAYQEVQPKIAEIAEKMETANDDEKKKLEEELGNLNETAKKSLEDAVAQGDVMRHMFNGKSVEDMQNELNEENKKPDGEKNQDKIDTLNAAMSIYHLQSQARLTLAIHDTSTNDTKAAEDLLNKIKTDDPGFFEDPRIAEQLKAAIGFNQQEYLDHLHESNKSGWQKASEFAAGLLTGESQAKMFKFAMENPKVVAELVGAVVAATAVTVATGGLGLGIGGAIVVGAVAGTVAGTAAGGLTTAIDASVNDKGGSFGANLINGMADTATSAATGSVIGALTAGIGAPAGAGARVAVTAKNMGSPTASELTQMFGQAVRLRPANRAMETWLPGTLKEGGKAYESIAGMSAKIPDKVPLVGSKDVLRMQIPNIVPKIGGTELSVGKFANGLIQNAPRMAIVGAAGGSIHEGEKIANNWDYYSENPGAMVLDFTTGEIQNAAGGAMTSSPLSYEVFSRAVPSVIDNTFAQQEYVPDPEAVQAVQEDEERAQREQQEREQALAAQQQQVQQQNKQQQLSA